jgi:hypothetical protein
MKCVRCDDVGWICENHRDQPWDGDRACKCGSAGAPCPACNAGRDDELRLPAGFKAVFNLKGWRH